MAGRLPSTIERIELYPFPLPLRSPFKIATMTATHAPNLLACVVTAGGVKGWGEASIMQAINGETEATVLAAMRSLAEWLIGKDARETVALGDFLKKLLPGQSCAHCTLETALWDVDSQYAGQPLWQRLGGNWRPLMTDETIGAILPENAYLVAAKLAAAGYKVVKLKIGTGIEEDTARYKTVRKALDDHAPGLKIRLDANQGYSRREAHEAFSGSLFEGAEFCEQPLKKHDLDGLAWLSGFSRVPIMADESAFDSLDVMEIIKRGACPLVNLKLTKTGGVWEAVKAAAVAEAGGLECMMGGMVESKIGVTAAAHVALSRGIFRYFDLDAHTGHAEDPIIGGVTYSDGHCLLPCEPGLGAHPDPAYLAKLTPIVVE